MLATAVPSLKDVIIHTDHFGLSGWLLRENLGNLMHCLIYVSSPNSVLDHRVNETEKKYHAA